MSSWESLLPTLVHEEPQDDAHFEQQLKTFITTIKEQKPPIATVVSTLGPYLTSDAIPPRTRAIILLAHVIKDAPQLLSTDADVHLLADFFIARINDWPAVRGALIGCIALLDRNKHPKQHKLPPLSAADAVSMTKVFTQHVFVSSLGAIDRAYALDALRLAIFYHGQPLLDAQIDLMEYTISSIDGEKDPRCLLASFKATRALVGLYQRQPEDSIQFGDLIDNVSELFDILSCYFPVSYTPSGDEVQRTGIDKEVLTKQLEDTFLSCPLFVDELIPLIMEKLSSTLRQAKKDSLSLLSRVVASYGLEWIEKHIQTIWVALKAEIVAPTAEGLMAVDSEAVVGVAMVALDCLHKCVKAFQIKGDTAMTDLILSDTIITDMLTCIISPTTDPTAFKRSVRRVQAGAETLYALCLAGGKTMQKTIKAVLPQLLQFIQPQPSLAGGAVADEGLNVQQKCLAWMALRKMLAGCAQSLFVGIQPTAIAEMITAALHNLPYSSQTTTTTTTSSLQGLSVQEGGHQGGNQPLSRTVDEYNVEQEELTVELMWQHPHATFDSVFERWLKMSVLNCLFVYNGEMSITSVSTEMSDGFIDTMVDFITSTPPPSSFDGSSGRGSTGVSKQQELVQKFAIDTLASMGDDYKHNQPQPTAQAMQTKALEMLLTTTLQQQPTACGLQALKVLSQNRRGNGALMRILTALGASLLELLPVVVDAINSSTTTTTTAASANGSSASSTGSEEEQVVVEKYVAIAETYAAIVADEAYAVRGAPATALIVEHLEALLAAAASSQCRLVFSFFPSPLQLSGTKGVQEFLSSFASVVYVSVKKVAITAKHSEIINLGIHWLTTTTITEDNSGGGSTGDGINVLRSIAACTVVVPIGPLDLSRLEDEVVKQVVMRCVELCLESEEVAVYASQAVAAIVNKDAARGEALANEVLSTKLFPALLPPPTTANEPTNLAGAWLALKAIYSSLALRASSSCDTITNWLINDVLSNNNASHLWKEAAAAFGTALQNNINTEGTRGPENKLKVAFNIGGMVTIKPLWNQRFYTITTKKLKEAQQQYAQQQHRRQFMTAQAHLVCAAPENILMSNVDSTLSIVLDCLVELCTVEALDDNAGNQTKLLVIALATTITQILHMHSGLKAAESHLQQLVPLLCKLSVLQSSWMVRKEAVQCLIVLNRVPYTLLHAYRKDVMRAAAAACDDKKRDVRMAAADCRFAWSS